MELTLFAVGNSILNFLLASTVGQYVLILCIVVATLNAAVTILMPLFVKIANATETNIDNKILTQIKKIRKSSIGNLVFSLIARFSLYKPKK